MKAVWKFPLTVEHVQFIRMPAGAKILHVEGQRAEPCMWALVETEAETESRQFLTVGTGHEMPVEGEVGDAIHVGTYMLAGGDFVGHVFEVV